MEAVFELEKETKNTIRYQEVADDKPPIIKTLYVQKWALRKLGNGAPPSKLRVTVVAE